MYDKVVIDANGAKRMPNGTLRAPAVFSRTGVQTYLTTDGKPQRAYRPPEEVSSAESLETLDGVVVTDDHPAERVVTTETARKLQRGHASNPQYQDGKVKGVIYLTDEKLIKKVLDGKVEVSVGYTAEYDLTPGVTPEGEAYDFVQRKIRANHVAVVDQGRAGPDVRIYLDSAVSTDFPQPQTTKETPPMEKLFIDGVEVELSATAASAVKKLQSQYTSTTAQRDALKEQVGKLEADLKTAPERVRAELSELAATVAQAKRLAPSVVTDELNVSQIRRAVVAANSKLVLDGKDDTYVSAVFDMLVESKGQENPAVAAVDKALASAAAQVTDSDEYEDARSLFLKGGR